MVIDAIMWFLIGTLFGLLISITKKVTSEGRAYAEREEDPYANWYLYELIEDGGKTLKVGITKNPDKELRFLTKCIFRPQHYGKNCIIDVIAGFDTKSEALEAKRVWKS